jgi:hypothetical protein
VAREQGTEREQVVAAGWEEGPVLARERGTEREQVVAAGWEEEPVPARERDPLIRAGVATQALPVAESRAVVVVVRARNSLAGVDRVQAAVPEVTTVAAQELA